ncbi:hypothetical protein CHS0354_010489 [Potamilus streckersoni]|uniref:BTB domain-containing protein n=1 Tax=Potamilus streckersoni TaxID=2493646 RepID=A0AAE0RRQ9_9BIVA|nr:hypothetical protein CHS0354_010489 [Potamilus streckersoni]
MTSETDGSFNSKLMLTNNQRRRESFDLPLDFLNPAIEEFEYMLPFNWQAKKAGVLQRFSFLFNKETLSDVHFIVGIEPNTQIIPAHKFILSIGSAVFDAMFNGPMANKNDVIVITDMEPKVFMAVLKYLYSDQVVLEADMTLPLLYAAKKYALPMLDKICRDSFHKCMTKDNIFQLLMQARMFDEPHLAVTVLDAIINNASVSFNAPGLANIDHETLCVIMERDTREITECDRFVALCKWATAECSRQKCKVTPQNVCRVLGKVLHSLKFDEIDQEEFSTKILQSEVLDDHVFVEILNTVRRR